MVGDTRSIEKFYTGKRFQHLLVFRKHQEDSFFQKTQAEITERETCEGLQNILKERGRHHCGVRTDGMKSRRPRLGRATLAATIRPRANWFLSLWTG